MGQAKRYRRTLGARTLTGDPVVDPAGNSIGRIEELMIDVVTGRVAYAVLSFGGFLGLGDKLFALPWTALTVDETNRRIVANVTRATLEAAPGFDKDRWPDLGDPAYAAGIERHYGAAAHLE